MDLVLDFFNNKIRLTRNDNVVIGVSAGPDSMCLLYLLMELRKKIGFKIIVAHVNHKKRIESEEEEHFLKLYAEKNDLIFENMSIDVYKKINFHAYAREVRYKFYEDLVKKYNASYLMTAHHGDDLIETILMRLVRGSTLKGYQGISLQTNMDNYIILRPLLYVTKEEIKLFNDTNNIPYRIDNSNFSDKYTRNRYRKYVLPFLKEENKNVHLKFLKFSNRLFECNNYIEKKVNIIYNDIYKDSSLDLELFLQEDLFIQKLVLEKVFDALFNDLSNINDKHIDSLIKLINKNKNGSKFSLPNDYIALISYGKILFLKDKDKLDYKMELVDGLCIPNGMRFVNLETKENGNDTLHLNSSKVKLPLYVRNRKEGDFIELKGSGTKKVKDIFIDLKISREKRDLWPIVVDSSDKIIWIPKLKKSKYDSQKDEKRDIIFKCL